MKMPMEVAVLQFASSGGVSSNVTPGTWVVGNHYTGTIEVQMVPYSGAGEPAGSISMFGIFTFEGFDSQISLPLVAATGVPCWGTNTKINFDVYCTSVPEISWVLNANGGAGEVIVNVIVDKNL